MSFPVLVADDNSDAGGTLAMVLEMLGHTVVRVEDGIAALDAAREMRPRAIFLDIGMPGISGWEVCRQICALPWGGEPHIFAVTGYGTDSDRAVSRHAGFDDHCTKPITLSTIQRLFGRLETQESAPQTTLVIFVGGPLHGTQRQMFAQEPKFWQVVPSGGAVMYERRGIVSADETRTERIVYAPVGMSENAFRDLVESLTFVPRNL